MSVISAFLNSKDFSKLILRGKEQAFLTPEEINDAIPASIVDYHELDVLLAKLEELNISINKVDDEEEETNAVEATELELIDEALSAQEEKELKA